MTTWKELPAGLEPDVVRFIEEVRAIKDARNLSFTALAEGTGYSKSSWERCLNSGRLPPEAPVRFLARRTCSEPDLLVALWELAEQAASGRGQAAEQPPAPDSTPPPPAEASAPPLADVPEESAGGPGRRLPRFGARSGLWAALAALTVVAGLLVVLTGRGGSPSSPNPAQPSEAAAGRPPLKGVGSDCHGSGCDGLDAVEQGCGGDAWTAAISRSDSAYIEVRYSSVCRAAWARIRWAAPGDRVDIVAKDGRTHTETVPDDPNLAAFTFMIGAPRPGEVRACWQTKAGKKGCTEPGGNEPLPEAPPVAS
ncbi:DUF2690 domain-containing protein [Streptomyces sp. NPDC006267]|uniref:helix-turn-helix domain-containing protein n=1 Tax=unclassified Streptomyces TaxID=2593676 RepID=UPI00339F3E93